jgi:hypothetical protein
MAETREVRKPVERARLQDWWSVPKSSEVVGYRVPIDVHNVSKGATANTSTISLPEDLVGKVVAWSATMSTRRDADSVAIETLGSHLGSIESAGAEDRSQALEVRWRVNPDVAGIDTEKDGLVCSLLLAIR